MAPIEGFIQKTLKFYYLVIRFYSHNSIKPLKHLYPMVLPIAHDDVPAAHDGDALQTLELAIAGAPGAEGTEERSVGVEDLDAIVAGVGYYDIALVINGDTPWELKLSIFRPLISEGR